MIALLLLAASLHGAPGVLSARAANAEEVAVFAGGCFWGVEAVFEHVKGVLRVTSGYTGGNTRSPTYGQVSGGTTGHAESVQIAFDPAQISYEKLLQIFFTVTHDPTQLNRQGPDVGTEYRSAIFYGNDEQKRASEAYIAQLARAKTFSGPIVTQVVPLKVFYLAEEYHQDFMAKNPNHPYIVYHDVPKVERLKKEFPELYK